MREKGETESNDQPRATLGQPRRSNSPAEREGIGVQPVWQKIGGMGESGPW